jgi:hypothetical protein
VQPARPARSARGKGQPFQSLVGMLEKMIERVDLRWPRSS